MFFVCGSWWSKKEEARSQNECRVCKEVNMKIYSMRQWFTLFFIPIFPLSNKKFYIQCLSCKNSFAFKKTINEELGLKQRIYYDESAD